MEKVHDLYTLIDIHKKGSTLDCENFKKDLTHRPHGQSANDDTNREVENSPGRTFIRRTGRVSQSRSTTQQIIMLKLIVEKSRRKDRKPYNCFVNFKKAFDSVDQGITWAVVKSYGVVNKLTNLLKNINETLQAVVRVDEETDQWFKTNRGTVQGDPISPTVFIADLERAMNKIKERQSGITIHGIRINNLRFADDVYLLEEKR